MMASHALAYLLPLVFFLGCGTGGPPTYSVKGTVTYKDETVPTGWVIFLSAEKQRSTAEIGSDGQYQTELPAGAYHIGVSAPRNSGKTGREAFDEPSLPPHVPFRFSDPKSSGLSATVEASDDNTIDLALTAPRRRGRR